MNLYCPHCRNAEASVSLNLDDGDTFTCRDCDEEFTVDDVQAMIDAVADWKTMLAWVERCPSRQPEAAATK